MKQNRLFAIIPAAQPFGTTLSVLAERLHGAGFKTVIVSYGPDSRTASVFTEAAKYADVISVGAAACRGGAIRAGLDYVSKICGETASVVTLAWDGSNSVEDALRVSHEAQANPGTLVLGCRALEKLPGSSRAINCALRSVLMMATGRRLTDVATGMRAFTADMIPRLSGVRGSGPEYEINMLIDLAKRDAPIRELPIRTTYYDDDPVSRLGVIKSAVCLCGKMLRFAASL